MIDLSGAVARLRDNWTDPSFWTDTVWPYVGLETARVWYNLRGVDGFSIWDEEWDTLVILDGCRYDLWVEENSLSGTAEARHMPCSMTVEFIESQLGNGTYLDTVYVTGNPQLRRHCDATFHDVIHVWDDEWDEQHDTVPPDRMADRTIEAHEAYPDKRIVTHFMQPHYPFIGELGREIAAKRDRGQYSVDGTHTTGNVWSLLKYGELSRAETWDAYAENLRLALPQVQRVVDAVDGRVVVTSDHGNLLGERLWPIPVRAYGHPRGVYHEKLTHVPWFVCDGSARRRTVTEATESETDRGDTAAVEDRLSALGYR